VAPDGWEVFSVLVDGHRRGMYHQLSRKPRWIELGLGQHTVEVVIVRGQPAWRENVSVSDRTDRFVLDVRPPRRKGWPP
jgi:hypothetical protein